MNDVVIAGAARTPMGGFQGDFDGVTASVLGGAALKAALDDAQIGSVDELYFGNVLPAGQGQAPARQAGFAAGLGEDVPATTLNKMCGSGMKATMIGYDQLLWDTRMLWRLVVWRACRMRRICCPKCVVAHGLGTLKSWITCSWMGWKTPMTKAVLWAPSQKIAPRNINSPEKPRMNMHWDRLGMPWMHKNRGHSHMKLQRLH